MFLSPLLFSLYINDIVDEFEFGVNVGNELIKALLYADDLVLIARNPQGYCEKWSLEVNLEKSKIMIFRNGGRLRSNEKWFYRSRKIDNVNQYKYLGVTFTSQLSLQLHFQNKVASSKQALNVVRKRLISDSLINLSSKLQVFNAVSRSIHCYGAQVWTCAP